MYFLLGKVICAAFLINTHDGLVSYAGEVVNSSLAIFMEMGVIFGRLFSISFDFSCRDCGRSLELI